MILYSWRVCQHLKALHEPTLTSIGHFHQVDSAVHIETHKMYADSN